MATKTLYRLTCDGCGNQTPLYPTIQQMRLGAKNVWKWTRRKRQDDQPAKDLCSRCSTRA
jgi:hypothetical protein